MLFKRNLSSYLSLTTPAYKKLGKHISLPFILAAYKKQLYDKILIPSFR